MLPSVAGIKYAVAPALADLTSRDAVVVRDDAHRLDLLDVSGSEPRIRLDLNSLPPWRSSKFFPDGTTLVTRVVQGASPDTVVLVAGGDADVPAPTRAIRPRPGPWPAGVIWPTLVATAPGAARSPR